VKCLFSTCAFVVFGGLLGVGCGHGGAANGPVGLMGSGVAFAPKILSRVSDRKPNMKGDVLVLMYHKFAVKETRYDRSFDHFGHDLERLYEMGFRPVTMSEYLADDMPLRPGSSPVVITMDDAAASQFQLQSDGSLAPDCAVGIWQNFAATHPDFPVRATFYVLPGVMWGQKEWVKQKVDLLKEWGSELGSHTWDHPSLRRLTDAQVKDEIAKSLDYLREKFGYETVSFAYPYGIYPKNMELLDGFYLKGRTYQMTGAVTCNTDLAPSPSADGFKPFKVNRVEAEEGELGVDWWLDTIAKGRRTVYVAP